MKDSGHPLFSRRPPDWLASVQISAQEQRQVEVGNGKTVPEDMLREALGIEVGSAVTCFSIRPEVVSRIVEFTERPEWRNLPTEPTSAWRADEDRWRIVVGDHDLHMDRAEIAARLGD